MLPVSKPVSQDPQRVELGGGGIKPADRKPRLLDLFCGAGGCSVGYHRAGFEVVGVDINPQPRYPFEFIQGDALAILKNFGQCFDVIHASPPCQRFSTGSRCRGDGGFSHPDLLTPTLRALELFPHWVVENVIGAPLSGHSALLCGLMFGLKVFRHRLFESSHLVFSPSHESHGERLIGKDGMECVVGHGGGTSRRMRARMKASGEVSNKRTWSAAMGGLNWMTRNEMSQAIPPAYTEYIGRQLMRHLGVSA